MNVEEQAKHVGHHDGGLSKNLFLKVSLLELARVCSNSIGYGKLNKVELIGLAQPRANLLILRYSMIFCFTCRTRKTGFM